MTAFSTETQGENQDTRLIPLSALQHYAFCPRQCALIHNEQPTDSRTQQPRSIFRTSSRDRAPVRKMMTPDQKSVTSSD